MLGPAALCCGEDECGLGSPASSLLPSRLNRQALGEALLWPLRDGLAMQRHITIGQQIRTDC
eukprot:scaffold529_cov308-Pinguiococcus_pyrenoidosus.AAC.45